MRDQRVSDDGEITLHSNCIVIDRRMAEQIILISLTLLKKIFLSYQLNKIII